MARATKRLAATSSTTSTRNGLPPAAGVADVVASACGGASTGTGSSNQEQRAAAGFAVAADAPAHRLGQTCGNGETKPCAWFERGGELLEILEQPALLLLRDARAGVRHLDAQRYGFTGRGGGGGGAQRHHPRAG